MNSIVIMGVAGCGKSSLGTAVARGFGLPLIEGDDHHSQSNRQKMKDGIALNDADRWGWLAALCDQLRKHPEGAVLTCSALKRSYRDQLRQAKPALKFVFLEISRQAAQERVVARGQHFFHSSLVDSQFATLETPVSEDEVLRLDASLPLRDLQAAVNQWLPEYKEVV